MKVGQSPHTSHKMWAFSPILHNRGTIIVFILRPHYGFYNNVCNLPSTSFLEQSEWIPSLTQGTTGFAGFCFSTDASSSPWDSAFWEQEMQRFKRAPSDQMIRSEILAQSTFSRCIASDCTPFPSSFVLGQPKAVGTRQVWGGCFCGAFLTLSNVTSPSQYLQLYLQTHSQKPGRGGAIRKPVSISGQGATTRLASTRDTLHVSCWIFACGSGATSWWSPWVTPLSITPWMPFQSPVTFRMQLWDPWACWGWQSLFYRDGSYKACAKLTK